MTAGIDIATNLQLVQARVAGAAERAGRDPKEITIIGVCKTMPIQVIRTAVLAGVCDLGENRVQEAKEKFGSGRPPGVTLHLIGHLQTNKARQAVQLFDVVHSVDSERIAEALHREAERVGIVLPVLIEVNVAGEESKQGVASADVADAVRWIVARASLRLAGLMTVAPEAPSAEDLRPVFRELRELRETHCPSGFNGAPLALSMGMSNDFEVAIEEGATHVRVGRAIFGARPQPA
ncbi:MAG: YggS family pyridoxal phosphate-dependent enzyme [Chloroflexi bacterium]|nr:YggS family pyridoxal phosphate-dependent enzyme [Chloroflexota bacterium]